MANQRKTISSSRKQVINRHGGIQGGCCAHWLEPILGSGMNPQLSADSCRLSWNSICPDAGKRWSRLPVDPVGGNSSLGAVKTLKKYSVWAFSTPDSWPYRVNAKGKEAQLLSLVISACSYWRPHHPCQSMAQPQNGSQEATMSIKSTGCSSVTTPNNGVAPARENSNAGTVTREDQEEMKHLKSTKEEIKETTSGDLHSDNDNVSFQLEEPRSSLKKGFNIEVGFLFTKCSTIIWIFVEKVRSIHTVSPLQTQIAGHGSENDGQRYLFPWTQGTQKVPWLTMYLLGDFLSMSLVLCWNQYRPLQRAPERLHFTRLVHFDD